MQETQVQPLGWEDPLQKEMVAHLLGKSHEQRSLVSCNPWGRKELDTTEQLSPEQWQGNKTIFIDFQRIEAIWHVI